MKYIVFISNGGLGNQLFQFSYLKKNFSDEKLLLFGFNDLLRLFNISKKEKIFTYRGFLKKLIFRGILKNTLNLASELRIIKSITQERINGIETLKSIEQKGVFNQIVFIRDSYFQSEHFIPIDIKQKLRFKSFLSKTEVRNFNSNHVFIHYRGGDFNEYKPLGKSVILPEKYFEIAISHIKENIKKPVFVIFGNEKFPYQYLLKDSQIKKIHGSSQYEDFYLMSRFQNAILSPSTFSWWATYFMERKNIIIVPKYWLGFNSRKYYPESPIASYMTEIDFI